MKGATGDLALTLTTIREVLSDFEAREVRRNIELDKPQGRAYVAKQLGSKPNPPSTPQPRDNSKRGDPARNTPNKKNKTQQGQWTNRY
eukprot:502979-Pleurochrysis_carterae.AAC.1